MKAIRWALSVALVVGIIALTLEGLVRFRLRAEHRGVYVLDRELGWVPRPSRRFDTMTEGIAVSFETNALGMRGPLPVGPHSRERILVLGDSFTQGCQVSDDELFSTIWQSVRPDLEIVNAGVGGYGTVQEALLRRRMAPDIQPDLTVLMVFENDPTDNVMPFYPGLGPRPYVESDAKVRPVDWGPFAPLLPHMPAREWLYFHSRAIQLWQSYRLLRPTRARAAREYTERWKNRMSAAERWEAFERLVATLGDGRLVLVPIPRRKDVRVGNVEFTRKVAQLAERLGAGFVDIHAVLRPEHYYRVNIHWNARGHEVVGHRLASAIE